MVFTNQTLGRAASLSHGGNEAARDTVVSVFDDQSSTLHPAGKAMSRSDRNPDRSDRADGWRSAAWQRGRAAPFFASTGAIRQCYRPVCE